MTRREHPLNGAVALRPRASDSRRSLGVRAPGLVASQARPRAPIPSGGTAGARARDRSTALWASLPLPCVARTLAFVDWRERITIEPGKRSGKPCIRGLRITVYDVLEYLASGMSEREILDEFPDLEADDLRAVYAFAADRERKSVHPPRTPRS